MSQTVSIHVNTLKKTLKAQGWKASTITKEAQLGAHDLYNIFKGRPASLAKLQQIAKILNQPIECFLEENKVTKNEIPTPSDTYLYRHALNIVQETLTEYNLITPKSIMLKLVDDVYRFSEMHQEKSAQDYCRGMVQTLLNYGLATSDSNAENSERSAS